MVSAMTLQANPAAATAMVDFITSKLGRCLGSEVVEFESKSRGNSQRKRGRRRGGHLNMEIICAARCRPEAHPRPLTSAVIVQSRVAQDRHCFAGRDGQLADSIVSCHCSAEVASPPAVVRRKNMCISTRRSSPKATPAKDNIDKHPSSQAPRSTEAPLQ